jgi:hypothetical protein
MPAVTAASTAETPISSAGRNAKYPVEPVEHEPRAVVDQALALDDGHEPPGHAQPPRDGRCGDRIGRRDDCAQHEGALPRQALDELVRNHRDRERGGDDEADCEQADRPHVRAQVAERGEERCVVQERRQHPEEHELRVEVELGHARQEAEHQPTEHEQDRVGDPYGRREGEQRRDGGEQSDGDDPVLHVEVHERIVPKRVGPTWRSSSARADERRVRAA